MPESADRRAYLDHAATAPMSAAAQAAVTGAWSATGNASAAHAAGRRNRQLLEESREAIAASLGAVPTDVVMTGSGTEANNMAVIGLFHSRTSEDLRRRRIVVSAVEHDAVLNAARSLEKAAGAVVEVVGVGSDARLRVEDARLAIESSPETVALVCVMAVNNETGTIQPVDHVAAIARNHGIPIHCDAVQGAGPLPLDFRRSNATTMAVSAHKVGGPTGVGALLVPIDESLAPISHGGGQERGVRSGTVDVAGAAGMAAALRETVQHREFRRSHAWRLRDLLVDGIGNVVPDARIVAASDADSVPGILTAVFPGCRGDDLVMLLDRVGIDVSAGSACATGVPEPSHVLLATGLEPAVAGSALRFSFGWQTTTEDIDRAVAALPEAVRRARAASAPGEGRRSAVGRSAGSGSVLSRSAHVV